MDSPKRSVDKRLLGLVNKPKRPAAAKPKKKKTKKSSGEFSVDLSALPSLSESELVSIAHLVGYENASRGMHRDDLIDLIISGASDCDDVLAPIREVIYSFVKGNERIMRSQMPCDLHCPTCPHHQVVECFTTNRDLVD
jgi:hypothetical protein